MSASITRRLHAQGLLAAESAALEVAELQKLVMKVFWSATYIAIPPLLLQEAQFTGWLECLLEAVRRPVPQVTTHTHTLASACGGAWMRLLLLSAWPSCSLTL